MCEVAIRTQDLGRSFGPVKALDKISLEIEKGSIVSLLGPNGAGKTTFLRLLMGLLEPTRGQACILGSDTQAPSASVVQQLGYMGDSSAPPSWATITQLTELREAVSPHFDRQFLRNNLNSHGLSASATRYGSLSKGQQKWVQASIALAARPQVLLMDEPAEGLDPSARRELYDQIRDYVNETAATVIVTTHVINDIERVADDVAILCQGRLRLHAPLETLRDQVRECEIPAGEAVQLPDSAEVLRQTVQDETQLTWVRDRHGTLPDLEKSSQMICRPVSLETLYLALTETSSKGGI